MSKKLQAFLGRELLALITDGEKLIASSNGGFNDYSFVVFPFAKAFEGYLKKLFFQIGAINEHQYNGDHWRVGRALNPQLEKEFAHDESVYDRIVVHCGGPNPHISKEASRGKELADFFWKTWTKGRNQVFHFFPAQYQPISFENAQEIRSVILEAMERGLEECSLPSN
jgi:hypothetical protein